MNGNFSLSDLTALGLDDDGIIKFASEQLGMLPSTAAQILAFERGEPDADDVIVVDEKGGPGSGNWGHIGRPGKVGGSTQGTMRSASPVTRRYFEVGPGRKMLDDDSFERAFREYMPGAAATYQRFERDGLIDALTQGNVQARHLNGLKKITADAPEVMNGMWDDSLGIYDRFTRTMHLSIAEMDGMISSNTVSHELGHHVTIMSEWRKSESGIAAYRKMATAYKKMQFYQSPPETLALFGLRSYSMTSEYEFMADVWKVYQYGTEGQWNALAELIGVDSLDSLFAGA